MISIYPVLHNKKQYLDLILLADEQESMIDRYLERGESPLTVPFYESCGFTYSHRIPDFFTDNYDHPIYEAGKQLKDMIYLKHSMHE